MKSKVVKFRDKEFKTPAMCSADHGSGLDCVAVAIRKDKVAIRSTHDIKKTTVVFDHDEWRNFVNSVRDGNFTV